jgi:hypothetical protein|tara:strand:- start:426 stop:614 length:189 start_codon:yes stop_codon:yes gene_type:complete
MSEWKIMTLNKRVSSDWQFVDYVEARSRIEAILHWKSSNPLKTEILDDLKVRLTAIMDGGAI